MPTYPSSGNPVFADSAALAAGASGAGALAAVNTRFTTVEDMAQLVESYLEKFHLADGYGAYSGGAVTAGAGLAASVAALEAFVGNYVQITTATTVGGLAASNTNYLWLRQSGVFTANTTGSAPSSGDGNGASLLWGTAVTDGSGVTSVTNNRALARAKDSYLSVSVAGSANVTLTVDQARNKIIKLTGAITANISLILPLVAGHMWTIYNATTGAFTVTVKGATGTGLAVTQNKTAPVFTDGTNFRLAYDDAVAGEFGDIFAANTWAGTQTFAGEIDINGALNHDGTTVGFRGLTPVAMPAAITQTYATTSTTMAAYTADVESSAYTGAADGEAKLTDLNALRVAYENLRVRAENNAQVLNTLIDYLQLNGLIQ